MSTSRWPWASATRSSDWLAPVIASIRPIATSPKSGPAVDSASGGIGAGRSIVAASASAAAAIDSAPSGPHPQPEVEAVEFQPVNLDLQPQQRPDVEPDPAAGRREDRAAGGIANGDAAEAERDAAVAAHQRGAADRNDVARAEPLLETAGDARIEAFEVDRPPGEQQGESADRRCDHENGDKDGADGDAARAPPEQRLARTRQRRA